MDANNPIPGVTAPLQEASGVIMPDSSQFPTSHSEGVAQMPIAPGFTTLPSSTNPQAQMLAFSQQFNPQIMGQMGQMGHNFVPEMMASAQMPNFPILTHSMWVYQHAIS
jgi:hypothetical protein